MLFFKPKSTALVIGSCVDKRPLGVPSKGAARGGAEGAQAPPLAIRILMFIS